jgi:hypothetical protein
LSRFNIFNQEEKKIENRTELKEKIHEKKNILQQNHEGLANGKEEEASTICCHIHILRLS